MGSLAVADLLRRRAAEVLVVNRTPARAGRLVASTGSTAVRAVPPAGTTAALARSDVLLACTTSPEAVVSAAQVRTATRGRAADRGPLVVCDLGLPRNVDPAVGALPGVVLLDLQTLRHDRRGGPAAEDVAAAGRIVAAQLDEYAARRRSALAAPAVVALREHAATAVRVELARLGHRLPDLDPAASDEIARAVRRLADKLLHAPTIALKRGA
jgi:glutamyl-tRNA reductase